MLVTDKTNHALYYGGVFIDEDEIVIKCKEDLINTYIENDHGELRDLYLAKCKEFGICADDIDKNSGTIGVLDRCDISMWHNLMERTIEKCKKLTLSDLKPRTRTEYEKVSYDSAWKAAKDHEERKLELWRKSDLSEVIKGNNWKAIQSPSEAALYHFDLYLKVEKEIDWRDESHGYLANKTGFHWSAPIAEVINDESDCFLELCRVALRANGEVE